MMRSRSSRTAWPPLALRAKLPRVVPGLDGEGLDKAMSRNKDLLKWARRA
jgi:hypothetical protein